MSRRRIRSLSEKTLCEVSFPLGGEIHRKVLANDKVKRICFDVFADKTYLMTDTSHPDGHDFSATCPATDYQPAGMSERISDVGASSPSPFILSNHPSN